MKKINIFLKNKKKVSKTGFTLIELLIVIAIIGLLSTLAIIALGNARAKARDARRVADIYQISRALDLYYADLGYYPTIITPGQAIISPDGTKTYISTIPNNPTPRNDTGCGNNNYTYAATENNNNYTLNFCLGLGSGQAPAGINSASSAGSGTAPGLVGWWKMDEGSGATSYDSSGYKNTGTRIGAATQYYTTAKLGPYAGNFEGANYINAGSGTILNFGTGNLSIVLWEKTTNTNQKNFIQKNNGGWGAGEMGFHVLKTAGVIYVNMGDGTNWFHDYFTANYYSGEYTHIAVVYDKTQTRPKLYLNGVSLAVTSHLGNDLNTIGNITVSNPLYI